MKAYYNEIDPFAAEWLRNLMTFDLIMPGDIDTRSIEDVRPSDLAGYTQCHFFAGIGVWSYALRAARWPDSRCVWTGSCPCQPFSAAGKGAGVADERHLWPAWLHLISECNPPVIFGEQVASKAADSWADLVQDDVEALGYAFGAVPFPAASVGAPHIRDRLYWLAVNQSEQRQRPGDSRRGFAGSADGRHVGKQDGSARDWLADDDDSRRLEHAQRDGESQRGIEARSCGDDAGRRGELGDASSSRGRRHAGALLGEEGGAERRVRSLADVAVAAGEADELADSSSTGLEVLGEQQARGQRAAAERSGEACELGYAGLPEEARQRSHGGEVVSVDEPERSRVASPWSDADFVWCRDGKWRPVEPGTFPLVNGAPARVGRLRGYGNAIVAAQAQVFIEESGLV